MEARALARLGEAKACHAALAKAVREFDQRRPENDPAWIRCFNEAELAAEFGHCLRDLGRAADASQHASQSLAAIDETTFKRSDFFAAIVLADAHLAVGELEQACGVALTALVAGEQIRSARCVNYLYEFAQRLAAVGECVTVAEFPRAGRRLAPMADRVTDGASTRPSPSAAAGASRDYGGGRPRS